MQMTINTKAKFTGEGDAFVDALVEACKKAPRASLECPCMPELIGRELKPYFSDDEVLTLPSTKSTAGSVSRANNKRKGSPSHLSRPSLQNTSGTPGTNSGRKHGKTGPRAGSPTNCTTNSSTVTSAAVQAASGRTAPMDMVRPSYHKQNLSNNNSAASSPSTSVRTSFAYSPTTTPYACPAMFASPKPETLPMPTHRLLQRAASLASAASCTLVMA